MTELQLVYGIVLEYSESLPDFENLIQELELGTVEELDEFFPRHCRERGVEPTPDRLQLAKDIWDLLADAVEGGFIDEIDDRMGDLLQMHGWTGEFLGREVGG